MKRIRSSTLAKIIAVFLFFLSLIGTVVCAVGVIFLIDSEAYFDGGASLKNNALDAAAQDYEIRLHQFADSLWFDGYYDEREFEDVFGESNCNYFFTLTDENGKILLTNYTATDTLRTYNESEFWCYRNPDVWYETPPPAFENEHCLTLKDGIRSTLSAKDRIYYYLTFTQLLTDNRYWFAALTPLLMILCVALLVFLCCAAGHHADKDEITLILLTAFRWSFLQAFWRRC